MKPPGPIPRGLLDRFSGWSWEVAWSHVADATVWQLTGPDGETRYLKLRVGRRQGQLTDERDRLVWAHGRLPVPRPLDHGIADGMEWLLLSGLPGRDATHPDLTGDQATLVGLLAQGLHAFHDVDPRDCPFDFRLDTALDRARHRVEEGLVVPEDLHREHQHLTPADVLARLVDERPRTEDVVVCHGDYCLPNVLIQGGQVVGYLDLGDLGLADRWWDLAVATWSVTWNLGPGWEDLFLEAYGVAPDHERVAYYRLLYDIVG